MRFLFILIFLLLPIITLAQEEPQINIYTSPLEVGDYLRFGEKSIRFIEVISDSRCPKNVTCVWAGEAKVLVEIFKNGKFLGKKIISTNSGNVPLNFQGEDISYGITSLVLIPYPTTETKKLKTQYTLHLKVSEKI